MDQMPASAENRCLRCSGKVFYRMADHYVYVVITQTGTVLSRILKLFTGAKYNHASVSFDDSMKTMYSFGRRNPYNPFWGGLVRESPEYGTFKRFHETEALIIALPIDEERYGS